MQLEADPRIQRRHRRSDPIVARIKRHTRAEYDHGKPADVLLRKRDEFLPKIEAGTLNRFEKLFQAINATL